MSFLLRCCGCIGDTAQVTPMDLRAATEVQIEGDQSGSQRGSTASGSTIADLEPRIDALRARVSRAWESEGKVTKSLRGENRLPPGTAHGGRRRRRRLHQDSPRPAPGRFLSVTRDDSVFPIPPPANPGSETHRQYSVPPPSPRE